MKLKNLITGWSALALVAALVTTLNIQAQRGGRSGGNFDQTAPAIGDKMPTLQGFDSEGEPWNTDQLKGQHTVIVFGCLT
ncbi:MAG: hypothetical protein HOH33_08910 [Verrucomicrobia bacterium]|jgi:cytochrome oxidase Cu insertion factor (SCO1/SenC/PrrC family)|nr:hypothetical protein [Verrucomicrobiota bacterium]